MELSSNGRRIFPLPGKAGLDLRVCLHGARSIVMGIGHAATRDFLSFLKHRSADDFGNPNPVAMPSGIRAIYSGAGRMAAATNATSPLGFQRRRERPNRLRRHDALRHWGRGARVDELPVLRPPVRAPASTNDILRMSPSSRTRSRP